MRRIPWLVGLLIVAAPIVAHAQPWSGILSPSRAVDWSNAGVPGGIPTRTTICSTLNPGATTAQIQSAINSCPANQVVFLNAGTYNIGGLSITRSNITLRGAGADRTKLVFTGHQSDFITPGASIVVFSGEQNDGGKGGGLTQHSANWTAGYAQGTTVVTLSSTAGLAVGNHLMLDQLDDSRDGWPTAGDIFICNNSSICTGEGGNNFAREARALTQIVTVTGINGLNVTIDPPIRLPNFRASQSPGAWWGNATVKGVGIEDMTLDHTGNGGPVDGIDFHNALNCWVKGVRSIINATSASSVKNIRMNIAARITIRDSYLWGPIDAANEKYGISSELVSDTLVENNILHGITSPIVPNDPDTSSVYGYNYSVGDRRAATMAVHGAAVLLMLLEGNQGTGFTSDVVHGTHFLMTQFRNHWQGNSPDGTNEWIQAYNRFFNVIGNVLGGSEYSTYESLLILRTRAEIFSLGDKRVTGYPMPTDPRAGATLMRWGNYDTVTGTVRFNPAEVPSSIANFANPVPGNQTLPASFYRAARPAWWSTPWGTPPWPAIGPDVTGGNVAGYAGHAHKIPARLCFENSAIDSTYGNANIRVFNASNCYGAVGQTVPAAPTSPVVQ